MKDPIDQINDAILIEMTLDVNVQLERGTGTRPVLWMLAQQRKKAREAMNSMVLIDLNGKPLDVLGNLRALQNEVVLYGDMVAACQAMLARGREADRALDEKEREEIADILSPADALRAGITPTPEDA